MRGVEGRECSANRREGRAERSGIYEVDNCEAALRERLSNSVYRRAGELLRHHRSQGEHGIQLGHEV